MLSKMVKIINVFKLSSFGIYCLLVWIHKNLKMIIWNTMSQVVQNYKLLEYLGKFI